MKIGMISGEFPPVPGGVGDFTRILAERLEGLGHELRILCRHGSAHESLQLSTVGGWGLGSLTPILEWARRHQPDVINLQFQTAAYDMSPFVHFLPGMLDVPLVTTFHDLRFPYLFPKAGRLRNWIVMHLARSSAGVITTNQEDDQNLQALPNRRLIPIGSNILSCGIAGKQRSDLRRCLGIDENCFLLGHFGFIQESKGVDYLLEAVAKLRGVGQDLRLVFIGGRDNLADGSPASGSAYLRQLEGRIRQLDLGEAIQWTGLLPDEEVAAYLAAVDLVVLPFKDGASYRRGSLMAAIHQGCAVLTTEPAVKVETFEHGDNLWLIAPGSAEAIEGGIAELMGDGSRLGRLRAGALELRRHFDWDVIARNTEAYFASLV